MPSKKSKSGMVGLIGVVGDIVGLSAVNELLEFIVQYIKEHPHSEDAKNEFKAFKNLVTNKSSVTLPVAQKLMENYGLKVLSQSLDIREADAKYKDFVDMQVVDIKYPSNKLKVGDTVIIKYITQEVLDRSIQLFDEEQKQKEIAKKKKNEKVEEQNQQVKKLISDFGALFKKK